MIQEVREAMESISMGGKVKGMFRGNMRGYDRKATERNRSKKKG